MFPALLIEKTSEGAQNVSEQSLSDAQLPEGDVTVRVEWSTLNYKDALAITGKGPIVRSYPMVPGIDCAGTVETSSHPAGGWPACCAEWLGGRGKSLGWSG